MVIFVHDIDLSLKGFDFFHDSMKNAVKYCCCENQQF